VQYLSSEFVYIDLGEVITKAIVCLTCPNITQSQHKNILVTLFNAER